MRSPRPTARDEHPAPCAINPTSQASAVAELRSDRDEASFAAPGRKVPRGTRAAMCSSACALRPRRARLQWVCCLRRPDDHVEGAITYAGQTFNTSADGKPSGTRKTLTARQTAGRGVLARAAPLSAALMVVPPPKVEDVELVEAVEDQVAQVNSRNVKKSGKAIKTPIA